MTGSALPRDLHPLAWWAWALGLAAAASMTTSPILLLVLVGTATVVVMLRRSGHPYGRSFRLYALLALYTVVARVLFRIVFGGQEVGTVLLDLPEVPLPAPFVVERPARLTRISHQPGMRQSRGWLTRMAWMRPGGSVSFVVVSSP